MRELCIRGKRLHVEERGRGFPILLGTSYLWDASMWAPQLEHLSGSYRCIVPELWAHGRSEPIPRIPYSLPMLADDMRAVADTLELRQFAIVGLSVGGMWGAQLALDNPERVKALVLMDTFVGVEPAASQARYFAMLDAVERAGAMPPALVEQIVPIFFAPESVAQNREPVRALRQTLLQVGKERASSIVALGRAIFSRASVLERMSEIRCPTLVVVGQQDRARPVHEAETMAGAIPGARLEVIEGAGHISSLEQPTRVNQLLDAFLGGLSA
jgi:pimeloyl-ACP methyl ester carboxylesterase